MHGIGTRHLRCFVEVARLASVGQAADALAISQPAVSKTLRELEERLGVAALRAGRAADRLTEAGRLFQKHAGLSLTELERGVRALRAPESRRAASSSACCRRSPRGSCRAPRSPSPRAVPGGSLRVSDGPNRLLLSQLREGTLELVVGRLAAPEEMTGLVFEQLYVERVAAVVRPGHPLIAAPGPGFAGFPLILPPPRAVIRPTVEQYFLSLGQDLPRRWSRRCRSPSGAGWCRSRTRSGSSRAASSPRRSASAASSRSSSPGARCSPAPSASPGVPGPSPARGPGADGRAAGVAREEIAGAA